MIQKKEIEAFILAGGKSSRMGSEKGLVLWKDKRFIEHIIGAIQTEVDKISIISNTDKYDYLGIKTHEDLIKERGPLSGIYTGLKLSTHKYNLFVSCDIPFIKPELIKFLLSQAGNHDILIPVHNGNKEPLCGIYHKKCTQLISGLVKHNKLGIIAALKYFKVKYVEISGQSFYSPQLLANINSPIELKQLEKQLHAC